MHTDTESACRAAAAAAGLSQAKADSCNGERGCAGCPRARRAGPTAAPLAETPAQGYTQRGICIPDAIARALDGWIERGEQPGNFVQAVLRNDLREAVGRADPASFAALQTIVTYLYSEAPSPCWGSQEKITAWAARFAPEDAAENSLEAPEAGLLSNLPHDA